MNKPNKTALAKSMGVSRGTLYYQSKMDVKDQIVREHILQVLKHHPAYGHRRIALTLGYSNKRVIRVMKKYQIEPLVKRRKRKYQSKKHVVISQYLNHLKHNPPSKPLQAWSADFTYIKFKGKFYYVATVIDVYSRELLSVSISQFHTKKLVISAFLKAVENKQTTPVYIHSDQGSEYLSDAYLEILKHHGSTLSLSSPGKPWENPFQESFYSNFKLELGDVSRFSSVSELTEAIYLQVHYYNHKRIHSALNMPPATFARQYFS